MQVIGVWMKGKEGEEREGRKKRREGESKKEWKEVNAETAK